jgi:hypothetical protein
MRIRLKMVSTPAATLRYTTAADMTSGARFRQNLVALLSGKSLSGTSAFEVSPTAVSPLIMKPKQPPHELMCTGEYAPRVNCHLRTMLSTGCDGSLRSVLPPQPASAHADT